MRDQAAEKQRVAIASTADDNGLSPLHVACASGHDALVALLVDGRAAVDARAPNLATPVSIASRRGHLACVTLLLSANAAADAADDTGATPTQLASRAGHYEVVEALVNARADVLCHDKDLRTPLTAAHLNRHDGIEELLVEAHGRQRRRLTMVLHPRAKRWFATNSHWANPRASMDIVKDETPNGRDQQSL